MKNSQKGFLSILIIILIAVILIVGAVIYYRNGKIVYTSTNFGISFSHPRSWKVEENESLIYVTNSNKDISSQADRSSSAIYISAFACDSKIDTTLWKFNEKISVFKYVCIEGQKIQVSMNATSQRSQDTEQAIMDSIKVIGKNIRVSSN